LPSGKHGGILTDFQTKVKKKNGLKYTFFGHPREGGNPKENVIARRPKANEAISKSPILHG